VNDDFSRKAQRVLKNHGVITYTPSRWPGIFSFLLTGALFTAALLLTFTQSFADDRDEGRHCYDRDALPYVMMMACVRSSPTSSIAAAQPTGPIRSRTKPLSQQGRHSR